MTQPLQQKTLMSLDVLMRLSYSPLLYYTYVKNDGSIQEAWHCVPLINPVNGLFFNPSAPGDFAEKPVLKPDEQFSGHCHAIKS